MNNQDITQQIQVNEPLISNEAKQNVNKALDDRWISSSGSFVKEFEDKFSVWLNRGSGVAVSSGTATLHIALRALGIKDGDEVIVPSFTMGSVWLAVLYVGATPVFVDADIRTWCIDANKISQKITQKTRAIIAVHTYGAPCNMRVINSIAKERDLYVIEDACEGVGSLHIEKKCGTFGDISCFSFFANKIISTGEGGMCVTDSLELAEKMRGLRNLCHSKEKRFIHDDIGYNYRMTNLQAAVGCGEMEHIEEYIEKKLKIAHFYNKELEEINGLTLPRVIRGNDNSYWMFGMLVDRLQFGISKDELRSELLRMGVDTRDFFYPADEQPILKEFIRDRNDCLVARYLSRNGLYLPSGLAIIKRDIMDVINKIKEIHYEQKKKSI